MMMSDREFVRKVLIVVGIGVLLLVFWQLSGVFMLAFGSILVAVILRAFAELLERYARAPERWSLALASLIIFALICAVLILFGTQIRAQFVNISDRLPTGINSLATRLGIEDISKLMPDFDLQQGSTLLVRAIGVGGAIANAVADFFFIVIAGLYIAASPRLYRVGLVKLFPKSQHERIDDSLAASGQALKLWVASQLIAMTCVGSLAAIAFWIIGLPSPLALGLIAGLLDFIPFLGPILGALPAVLVAFSVSLETALWTMGAMLLIQQIEGNVIFPLIGKRVIQVPPALALFAILAGGVLFGIPGLIFGFPLSVVVFVLVKKLYVRETLGEQTPVPGEDPA
ncbi:AI-2E family transporter [Microvirga pudoricolor]|uniref:AI-2E family transporter n=1 Tax=Microvirga pudoricolor TaxID=2778729 RepID=UPI00194FF9F4|nr:AI-2E family transporter [Microvirga pudoricolor]MBM6592400.1 AI-2E family transporter [Microvirga pudoricolor]